MRQGYTKGTKGTKGSIGGMPSAQLKQDGAFVEDACADGFKKSNLVLSSTKFDFGTF